MPGRAVEGMPQVPEREEKLGQVAVEMRQQVAD